MLILTVIPIIRTGSISATIGTDRQGFVPGEEIAFSAEVKKNKTIVVMGLLHCWKGGESEQERDQEIGPPPE